MATISGLRGRQFTPLDEAYSQHAYQYATSSYQTEHDMNPGLIVLPQDKEDIKLAITYAVKHNKAIAIRSGGHQYSGASSTGSSNIQMDLRHTFRRPDDLTFVVVGTRSCVRASVSYTIGELNAFLGSKKAFVPHGQCAEVCLGGHVQTGGYGVLGRSFGLLGDHVQSLEVIDYAGTEREITQDTDPELFFAWLGGSPGNLGVLTHVTIQVYRDEDYQGSMGLRVAHLYSKEKLRELVGYLAEMSDDQDFPRNYDLCISVYSSNVDIPKWTGISMDSILDVANGMNNMRPAIILVYAQWVPFSPHDKPDLAWFERLKNDSRLMHWLCPSRGVETKPMSELSAQWTFGGAREFDLPYVKRTYTTNSTNLSRNGWVDWVVGRMDMVMQPWFSDHRLGVQLQCFGGKNSQFAKNASNGTSYSWRDQTMCMVIDNFYRPDKKKDAEAWQLVNYLEAIGPDGIFSNQDRRVLWGSWGSFDLDKERAAYFDTEGKYRRIQRARKLADPLGTFTPNSFAVKRVE